MCKVREKTEKILDSWVGIIFFFVSIFFLYMPYECEINPFISSIKEYVKIVIIILLLFCFIVLNENIKTLFSEEMLLWGAVAFTVLLVISTKVNGGLSKQTLWENGILVLSLILLISIFFKVNIKKYLFCFFAYFLVINTLNNASVFYFYNRGGMWTYWGIEKKEYYVFVGHVNNSIQFAFPGLAAGFVYALKYNKHWNLVNYVNLTFSLATALKTECIVLLVACILIAVVSILYLISDRLKGIRKALKWINAKTFIMFDVLVFLVVIPLGKVLLPIFGLTSSMHGRRALWDKVAELIVSKPIIGNGDLSGIEVTTAGNTTILSHSHSLFLQIPLIAGFVGMAIFIILILMVVLSVSGMTDRRMSCFIGTMMGIFFLCLTVEVYGFACIYLCVGLFYYTAKHIKDPEQGNKEMQ